MESMFATTTAQAVFQQMGYAISYLLTFTLITSGSIFMAMLMLGWGIRHVGAWIFDVPIGTRIYDGAFGERLRYFGKPPWRGYNRWRSAEWNREHTL